MPPTAKLSLSEVAVVAVNTSVQQPNTTDVFALPIAVGTAPSKHVDVVTRRSRLPPRRTIFTGDDGSAPNVAVVSCGVRTI